MHDALKLLDQAIVMGREELAHLAAGDLEKAEAVDSGRTGVIDLALKDENLDSSAEVSLDSLLAKLSELKEIQARIIDEAARLQHGIGAELRRASKEQKRHVGYGQAARPPRRIQSHFVSRQS